MVLLVLSGSGDGYPIGVDPTFARNYLRLSFEQARGLPYMMEIPLRQAKFQPDPADIFKRLHNYVWRLDWYLNAAHGSIYSDEDVMNYGTSQRQNFSNQMYRKEILEGGKTHVAIGFVDLGSLLASEVRMQGPEPLRFIGYEISAFAVAKTLLIREMLLQQPKSELAFANLLRSILQVWFSATWTKSTLAIFRLSISTFLARGEVVHADVKALIDHWSSSASVSLEIARAQWSRMFSGGGRSNISRFLQQQDRIAFARYYFTQQTVIRSA